MVLEGRKVVRDKPIASQWFNEMNAISRGVETRLDSLTGFSGMVTLETVAIARRLRIPERQIKRWAASRFKVECNTKEVKSVHIQPLKKEEAEQWVSRRNTVIKPRLCQPLKLS